MDECRDHLYLCRKCFLEKKNAADLLERRETTFLVRINFMFLVKFLPDITLELEVVRMKGFCGWARRSWVFPRWIRRRWESGGSSLYWSKSPMTDILKV